MSEQNESTLKNNALLMQLLQYADVLAPGQFEQLQRELAANTEATAVEVISASGFLTREQLDSLRLASEILMDDDNVDSVSKDVLLKCSFCDKDQNAVGLLITGPGRHICNDCLIECSVMCADPSYAGGFDPNAVCSFCGQKNIAADKFVANSDGSVLICDNCLQLCHELIIEHAKNLKNAK